jgi:hypothetical protein
MATFSNDGGLTLLRAAHCRRPIPVSGWNRSASLNSLLAIEMHKSGIKKWQTQPVLPHTGRMVPLNVYLKLRYTHANLKMDFIEI